MLRPSLERFRRTQLRVGSSYHSLRRFIPVLALATIWLWLVRRHLTLGYSYLLGLSITMRHLLLALCIVALWNMWLGFSAYTWHSIKKDLHAELGRLFAACVTCGTLPLIGNVFRAKYGQGVLLDLEMSTVLMMFALALLITFIISACLKQKIAKPRIAVVIGSGRGASALKQSLQNHYSRFKIYGCVDNDYLGADSSTDGYLGNIANLAGLLKAQPIEMVLIGLPIKSKYDEIQEVIRICENVGVKYIQMNDLFDTTRARLAAVEQEQPHPFMLSLLERDPRQYIKRLVDVVGALFILIMVSPIMIAAAIAVRMTGAGSIFFVQQRYGHHRTRFPMFKFRTMVVDAEQRQAQLEAKNEAQGPVFKLKADPRVTSIGAILRRTSIDELPQLFNVLRGEMSLVGPRPLPLRDVSRFEEVWLLRRFSIKPGMTCLWQISGRSNTSFDDWIRQDLIYIDNWSLGLDLKILIMTLPAVLRGSGAM